MASLRFYWLETSRADLLVNKPRCKVPLLLNCSSLSICLVVEPIFLWEFKDLRESVVALSLSPMRFLLEPDGVGIEVVATESALEVRAGETCALLFLSNGLELSLLHLSLESKVACFLSRQPRFLLSILISFLLEILLDSNNLAIDLCLPYSVT